jgi:hypothetical protein
MSAYSDFLKRQSENVQDDILGKAQADGLRNGGTVDKFTGTKPLSLEQFAGKAQLISGKPAKQKD